MSNHGSIDAFDAKLNSILGGGLPSESFNVIAGEPGTGKSIFVQQWLFHYLNANPEAKVLYLTTMSEPPAKVIRYMRTFDFFEPDLFQSRFALDDVGSVIRDESFDQVQGDIVRRVKEAGPDILVVDSFKAIRDLAPNTSDFRRFVYQLAVRLSSQRCTTFLVGEYPRTQALDGAEFAVADGIFTFGTRSENGEVQRVFQVEKLRGRGARRVPVPFSISRAGIQIEHIETHGVQGSARSEMDRRATGVEGLDQMIEGGLFPQQAILVSGVSGTGKTTLMLQIAHHASNRGERVLYYSFEEPVGELISTAKGFGWDLSAAIDEEVLSITHVPQTSIEIDHDISRIDREVREKKPQWVIIDSFSVFLHRVHAPDTYRDKMYQMKQLLQATNAVGLLISDIPANAPGRLSRMGVEETVADGTIVLSTKIYSSARRRFFEVYKLRETAHVTGEHRMAIGSAGIEIYFRNQERSAVSTDHYLSFSTLTGLLQGKLRYDSAWLVRGEPGIGKSTLAMQFAMEGLKNGESVLIVTADAPDRDVERRLSLLGLEVAAEEEAGRLRILDGYSRYDDKYNLSDFWVFMTSIRSAAEAMARPLRIVFDSITPIAVLNQTAEFVGLIHSKNRLLRDPQVALFDTHFYQGVPTDDTLLLLNGYDIVIDLYSVPEEDGGHRRVIQVAKARDVPAEMSPKRFSLDPSKGLSLT